VSFGIAADQTQPAMIQPADFTAAIVVAGDVVIDRHLHADEHYSLPARDRRGVREITQYGGANFWSRPCSIWIDRVGRYILVWNRHRCMAHRTGQDGYALSFHCSFSCNFACSRGVRDCPTAGERCR
jgi:hypothetical protein